MVNLKNNFKKQYVARDAVALRFFPSRRWENDRLVLQQLNLEEKPIFESKKLSMETLMDELSQSKEKN